MALATITGGGLLYLLLHKKNNDNNTPRSPGYETKIPRTYRRLKWPQLCGHFLWSMPAPSVDKEMATGAAAKSYDWIIL